MHLVYLIMCIIIHLALTNERTIFIYSYPSHYSYLAIYQCILPIIIDTIIAALLGERLRVHYRTHARTDARTYAPRDLRTYEMEPFELSILYSHCLCIIILTPVEYHISPTC